MSKHTRGPWHAGNIRIQGAGAQFYGCDVGAKNGSNVAIVLHQSTDREASETIANARLIAAAPDLLEALRRAERRFSGHVGNSLWDRELTDVVLTIARVAIANATGGKL